MTPNATDRFTGRASDYVAGRPSYPEESLDALFDGLGDPAALTVVDLGAGTGIAARLLAARGVRVIAVEPNAAMREHAVPAANASWKAGTAEQTGLARASVDLAAAFQAFHWFDHEVALREMTRIVRPGGRAAVVYNERDDMTVARVWGRHAIRSHRLERYMASDDPDFERKVTDVIGLYLNPPAHAAVFCVDEKTAIQALDRLDPVLPLSPGRAEPHGFEYYRHGTLSLYAAFDTKTGEVLGKTAARHTSAEFVAFLTDLVARQPRRKGIHVIVNDLSAHKTKLASLLGGSPAGAFEFHADLLVLAQSSRALVFDDRTGPYRT